MVATRVVPIRDRFRQKKRLVLFICTGNTCRSPMAAAYFKKLLEERGIDNVEVRSAGVMTINGLLASQEAIQVMEAEDIDLRRHRSTPLTPELVRKASLILAMTPFHRQTAIRMCDEAKDKTHLLKEFTGSDLRNVQIADPMGCTLEVFKKVFKEIKAACNRLVEHEFITGVPKQNSERQGSSRARSRKSAAARSGARAAASGKSRTSAKKTTQTSTRSRSSAGKAATSKASATTARTAARKKTATAGSTAKASTQRRASSGSSGTRKRNAATPR